MPFKIKLQNKKIGFKLRNKYGPKRKREMRYSTKARLLVNGFWPGGRSPIAKLCIQIN